MKIAVYDSGLGSLSVIEELQKQIPSADLIYLADRKHFPYGKKTHDELKEIIIKTNEFLVKMFSPDLIVVASNTPSIQVLPDLNDSLSIPIIGVLPPIEEAVEYSKTGHIAILATDNTVKSKELADFIKSKHLDPKIKITFLGISSLVDLVESGDFLTNPEKTKNLIWQNLSAVIKLFPPIDAMTLSSTHLPFLKKYLEEVFPKVRFFNPAKKVAQEILQLLPDINGKKGSLRVYVSGEQEFYQKIINKLGFNMQVRKVDLDY